MRWGGAACAAGPVPGVGCRGSDALSPRFRPPRPGARRGHGLDAGGRPASRRAPPARDHEGARPGLGAVEGAHFALLGLLIAFTFSGAAIRFDARRALIVEEANAIGTAWLRLDLLPDDARADLQASFPPYVEARIAAYRSLPDVEASQAQLARAAELQTAIWARAVAAVRAGAPQPTTMLLLPALNQMFDIGAARTAATRMHPPAVIYVMLVGLSLMPALLVGYAMAGARARSLLHMAVFALMMAVSICVILDLEHPRAGLIRVDAADKPLVELLGSMEGRSITPATAASRRGRGPSPPAP